MKEPAARCRFPKRRPDRRREHEGDHHCGSNRPSQAPRISQRAPRDFGEGDEHHHTDGSADRVQHDVVPVEVIRRAARQESRLIPLVDGAQDGGADPRDLHITDRRRQQQHDQRVLRIVDALDRVDDDQPVRQEHQGNETRHRQSDEQAVPARPDPDRHERARAEEQKPHAHDGVVLGEAVPRGQPVAEVRDGQVQEDVGKKNDCGGREPHPGASVADQGDGRPSGAAVVSFA